MQVRVKVSEGRAVIRLAGRFDFSSHHVFREAIDAVLASPATAIAVDFGDVDYLDSSALGMLLMLRDQAKGASREVTLASCHGPVRQILDIANFGKLFPID
jgi:anti-anti-sigma factor